MKVLFSLALLLMASASVAQAPSAIPALTSPVVDSANVIRGDVKARLERVLREVNDRGVAQIQVLTVPSLHDEAIESYSLRVVDQWLLGDKKKDNGVLVLVSVGDRRSRIEIGQGLEGAIPDVITKQIQSQTMRPLFRAGDFGGAIEAGVSELIRLADAEYGGQELVQVPKRPDVGSWVPLFQLLLVLFILFVGVSGRRRRGRGAFWGGMAGGWGAGSSWGSGSSWGGGGSGWGGGSGGWGGGGGGFSGGGASDSW